MTPPDTNISRQTRRHLAPLIGIAIAVLVGVGVIFYWIGEEVGTAPAPPLADEEIGTEALTPEQLNSGDVDVPPSAPVREVTPEPLNPGLSD